MLLDVGIFQNLATANRHLPHTYPARILATPSCMIPKRSAMEAC